MKHRNIIFLVLILLASWLLAKEYYSPQDINEQAPAIDERALAARKEKCAKLDSYLCDLVLANPSSRQQVRVIIETNDASFKLSDEYGREELRADDFNMVQASVYVNKLLELSVQPGVRLVRKPSPPMAF